MGPLDGVKILELADFQTTGGAVVLAEVGAYVIKVEDDRKLKIRILTGARKHFMVPRRFRGR